jgi:hypothetical protein
MAAKRNLGTNAFGHAFILLPSGSYYVGILAALAKPRRIRVHDDVGNVIETLKLLVGECNGYS